MNKYIQKICSERPQIRMNDELESAFYKQRILLQENPEVINQILNSKKPLVKTTYHTPCFPHLEVTLKGANSTLKLPSTFNLHSTLLSDTTYHRETLDRLGLLKPRDLYTSTTTPK